ncbi:class I SAM-dependent methyltransferase [Ideonella dechloratans]|uniref:Class I SAM-dependent methyltransferase n=1 Tax=Ideonella dechloratans TaxID=36863 RepID=A0A643FC97_IDEDE|nr:class I SAM-dependent methyltransferase [Ideonella dechloratans]KAB0583100.1 class I SAM-dependent methyltransferase [Ideonella dechloratans]UFU11667.1 class I SAM-dependent methyltransferase [Ideonella dechloratans]
MSNCSPRPSDWVTRWTEALPPGSRVLDLACGSGRHLHWLATRGYQVTGVDRDLSRLADLAGQADRADRAVPAELLQADLESGPWPLAGRQFDAVVVTNYLWRPRWAELADTVAPGGLLVYETFGEEQASIGKPSRPDFLLRHGELLTLCQGWRVLGYEDGFVPAPDRFVQRIAAVRPGGAARQHALPVLASAQG